jgi:uncharacterized protein YnzC (UPF0291/DUF896 family)
MQFKDFFEENFNYFAAQKLAQTMSREEKYGLHMLKKYGIDRVDKSVLKSLVNKGLADRKGITEKGLKFYNYTVPKRTSEINVR